MSTVRFGILGPLEITGGAPQAAKLRVVLGTLLVRANEVVSVDTLIDELWPEAPPRTATTTLQVYVSHLRKSLRAADPHDGREVLVTRRPGYLLQVGAGELDAGSFDELARRGHRALLAGDFAAAADLQRRALALWRGPLLSDTPHGPLLDGAAVRLGEARTTVLDERVRAELHLGMHRELVAELQELVAEHPLHEEFHAHLMVALYRCGRQAEALRVFALLRQTLVEELGIEPGPHSRQLQRRILEGDPELARAGERETVVGGEGPSHVGAAGGADLGPLPASDPWFTGRGTELDELEGLLRGAAAAWAGGGGGGGGRIAVTGMPGAGKTALAVEAAHRVADAFPGGVYFTDLRHGAGGGLPPRGPGAAVAGGPGPGSPALVVVDGVSSEAQVRPLLALGHAVLLTARRVPAGLPGLRVVVLGPWHPREARRLAGLFGGHGGARGDARGGARAEPEVVAAVAELCGRLPLAVRAAAAQLAARPHWTPATLAERLRGEDGRLDVLRSGDVDVRARLMEAYASCPAERRREFRLLSVLPPGRFGARQAAAALDLGEARALGSLEALADERLVEASDRGSWRLPELLRLLAVERLAEEEAPEVARAVALRVCRAYAEAAEAAVEAGRVPEPGAAGLVRLARTAYDAGLWELTVRLTDAGGGWASQVDAETEEACYTLGLDAARRYGDRCAQARMLRSLGELAWRYRRLGRAQELFAEALERAREAGDEEEAGRALVGLAELRLDRGATVEAAALLEPALAALAAPGRTRGRYEASRARALVALAQEGPESARVWFDECLRLAGTLRDHRLETYTKRALRSLGAGSVGPAAGGVWAVEARPGVWRICSGGLFGGSPLTYGEPWR
ncbi:AfsR/SARP family transcriptional regulator [Streptomyces sp. NBC_01351]|uniref:AfsR/SARP family transcriptional regulator n=1 Tax=Streptomyces sp. NBC_01351 TaxID=2903833 RepID=UPI002E2FF3DA|nr:AfsR/SARP family transcriptional regulator [Streptomyces sp. NBC_01351]